jgi:hypothetical protein
LVLLTNIKATHHKAQVYSPFSFHKKRQKEQTIQTRKRQNGGVVTLATIFSPLFENRLLVEQRIGPTNGVKRNNSLSSAIGRCGARKPRTTFCSISSFFIGIVILNYRYLFQTSWFR